MRSKDFERLKDLLEAKVAQYNQPGFIEYDPISIPHQYTRKQDIEIAGFVASMLAWGQRKTIVSKCNSFFQLMDNSPYEFIRNHSAEDLKPFLQFKHRTFNATDALYFIQFFKSHYAHHDSLEAAFTYSPTIWEAKAGLSWFFQMFFADPDHPRRTYKHIPNPAKKSACKRMNMFLRWMVRKDTKGVDFGIWDTIKPAQLICPCDVHVDRVGRALGLISRKQTDWETAVELTENLKLFDANDPVKYDFALFGMGVEEK